MAKKKKAVQSTDAKEQAEGGAATEDLGDEEVSSEGSFEETELPVKQEDEVARRMITRRKLEQYLEERRLKKELGDDFDL